MKTTFVAGAMIYGLMLTAQAAESSTKLEDVHLCCQSCVKGVQAAIAKVPGASATCDKDAGTVTLSGPDRATVQKAADSLVQAGYFGKSSESKIKMSNKTGAKGESTKTLKVEGVHLCCGKCVTAVNDAVKAVPGVKETTAMKNAKSFEVTGDFKDKDVIEALNKAGLAGRTGN